MFAGWSAPLGGPGCCRVSAFPNDRRSSSSSGTGDRLAPWNPPPRTAFAGWSGAVDWSRGGAVPRFDGGAVASNRREHEQQPYHGVAAWRRDHYVLRQGGSSLTSSSAGRADAPTAGVAAASQGRRSLAVDNKQYPVGQIQAYDPGRRNQGVVHEVDVTDEVASVGIRGRVDLSKYLAPFNRHARLVLTARDTPLANGTEFHPFSYRVSPSQLVAFVVDKRRLAQLKRTGPAELLRYVRDLDPLDAAAMRAYSRRWAASLAQSPDVRRRMLRRLRHNLLVTHVSPDVLDLDRLDSLVRAPEDMVALMDTQLRFLHHDSS